MKLKSLTTILSLLLWVGAFAQNKDIWTAFWNKDRTLIGFKDKGGQIKIVPKFNSFTSARRFDNVICVSDGRVDYYLTKKGRIVGKNNAYVFDNGFDCESEGFIRFRDKVTHKVGMFNSNGDVAIPADYDNLRPVRNGIIVAFKNGHWDATKKSEINEFPWIGSQAILIDTLNNVLIKDFRYNENINFFSLMISKQPNKNPIRQNFEAIDGRYYSFKNFDEEFKSWLKDSLLSHLTKSNLLKFTYRNITFWDEKKHWINQKKQHFFDRNFEMISSKLKAVNFDNHDCSVFTEGLNPYLYNSKDFGKYYDNCGASKDWIYPIKSIVITHFVDKGLLQDQFDFLRTTYGYRLIEVSIKVGEIKE